MTPLDLAWAASTAQSLWPDSEIRGNSVGNLRISHHGDYVGWIDTNSGTVHDANSAQTYERDENA